MHTLAGALPDACDRGTPHRPGRDHLPKDDEVPVQKIGLSSRTATQHPRRGARWFLVSFPQYVRSHLITHRKQVCNATTVAKCDGGARSTTLGNFSVCSPLRDLHTEGQHNILTVRHPRMEGASTADFKCQAITSVNHRFRSGEGGSTPSPDLSSAMAALAPAQWY